MFVVKRDGSTVEFNSQKIINAIEKANENVDEQDRICHDKIEEIAREIESKRCKRIR